MKPLIYIERGANLAVQLGGKEPMTVVPQSRNGLGCRYCVFNATPVCSSIACCGEDRFDNEDVLFLPLYPDRSRGGEDE